MVETQREKSAALSFLTYVRSKPLLCPCVLLLRLFSGFFFVGSTIRKYSLKLFAHCQRKPAMTIVSVGSVTVGGAGKTPVILFLMNWFSHLRLGYVSRGYGRSFKRDVVSYGTALQASSSVGDEAFLVAKRDPSLLLGIGSSKRRMVRKLDTSVVDLLFLDDGLQRYDVSATVEIGVLPESLLFQAESLMPAGLLREPMSRLNQTSLLFVIKESPFTPLSRLVEELKKASLSRYVIAEQRCSGWIDVHGSSEIAAPTKRLVLFSGIARPERVITLLKTIGFEIADTFFLGDHEALFSKKFSEWAQYWHRKGVSVVGTEKDWARHVPWPKDLHFCTFIRVDLELLLGEEELINLFTIRK